MAPFERPSLTELVERTESEISSRLGIGPLLDRSFLKVIARVMAGATHGTHGHLDYNAAQLIPTTASTTNLERWSEFYGLSPVRRPATPAAGTVTFTGTNGIQIPAGTQVQRADGVRFDTDALATISGGSASVAVTALEGAAAGNTATGSTVSLVSPISGVNDAATVDSPGLALGADQETDAQLRVRLRDFVRARPDGGSVAAYSAWALEVSGVTRVFVLPANSGLGTVDVTFLVDDDPVSPIPDAAKVAEVQARLTDSTRRDSAPVTATVTTFAPVASTLNFTLSVVPDTAEVRSNVQEALRDLLLQDATPGGTLTLNKINEAISTAAGETSHVLDQPAADVTVPAGNISILGTVTFT